MYAKSADRRHAQEAFLDIFTSVTKLPIGLYEIQDGGKVNVLFTDRSLRNFEDHCKMIQVLPGGKAKCERDQCNRTHAATKNGVEELTLCHAGMYNQAVPVIVDDQVRAVLLYGEMQIDDPQRYNDALAQHEEAVKLLRLSKAEAQQLRHALLSAKRYSPEQLKLVKDTLPKVAQWFYELFEEEDRTRRHVEKITHELQTRLQSVLGDAENLFIELSELKSSDVRARIGKILSDAEALSTLVNGLGDFQAEYRFEPTRLLTLLTESKRIYETEAEEHGVRVQIDLEPLDGQTPILQVCRDALQLAFNNLMHNAIKYSFRGRRDRPRHVRIWGERAGPEYAVAIENYGIGITPEEIETRSIFEDGVQGVLTEGEYRTGSGKGLFFADQVVKQHKGRIQVTSKKMSEKDPQGQPHLNQFTVYLPIERLGDENA